MKIAILGTRGIPNNYGGFEQLAEWLSQGLIKKGHTVYVYSSHTHPYKQSLWQGVNIIHQYDPESKLGSAGQFIYDYNCFRDTNKHQFDIILNLGYTSSAIWLKLFTKRSQVITNMDGLEWRRTKYSGLVKVFLKYAEKLAALNSHSLIADSRYIQKYLFEKYKVKPYYIAYGAELFKEPRVELLAPYGLKPFAYNMIVARMEPENNIEMILDGIQRSKNNLPFIVISNSHNSFGRYLRAKYKNEPRIQFLGAIFDNVLLNNLRHYSHIYFHGHSVGGTNPSLLEAMGCKSFIAANENEFNRGVLGEDALFFTTSTEVAKFADDLNRNSPESLKMIENNYAKIYEEYSWQKIIQNYEDLMLDLLNAAKLQRK